MALIGRAVILSPSGKASAVLIAKMVEARPGGTYLKLGAQLLGHERVDDPAKQLAVVQDRLEVRPQDGGHQPSVHDIALGCEREPLEPVSAPCGKCLDHEDVLEDPFVGSRCSPVDPSRLVDALGFGDPC
jgi:hypothetical protein